LPEFRHIPNGNADYARYANFDPLPRGLRMSTHGTFMHGKDAPAYSGCSLLRAQQQGRRRAGCDLDSLFPHQCVQQGHNPHLATAKTDRRNSWTLFNARLDAGFASAVGQRDRRGRHSLGNEPLLKCQSVENYDRMGNHNGLSCLCDAGVGILYPALSPYTLR